jgi:octaprenyl-diphosphate synthase
MAFQIRDDIFDYEKTNLLGKPIGNDIIERKITLPLIYALKQVDLKKQKEILKFVKQSSTDRKNISAVRDFVLENSGTDYATLVAKQYIEKAISLISNLDNSPAKQSLIGFAHYMIKRNK